MQQKLLVKTLVFTVLFTFFAMSSIIYVSANKAVVISDVAQEEVEQGTDMKAQGRQSSKLVMDVEIESPWHLEIPLEEGTKAEAVIIENRYMSRELWVLIDGQHEKFYQTNTVTGDQGKIIEGSQDNEKKMTRLKFTLTGVYEYRSILEGNSLFIEFIPPGEMYDHIVVIDPAGGEAEFGHADNNLAEKNITLSVAKKLKEKLDKTGIKAYYTRFDDSYQKEEDRAAIANLSGADFLIRIQVGADADTGIYGTEAVYNAEYFIPEFGNVQLADLMEREVVTSIEGIAIGLRAATEEDVVLQQAKIPAAAISIGYITNEEEAKLMGREDYLERVAEGIYRAVIKACET